MFLGYYGTFCMALMYDLHMSAQNGSDFYKLYDLFFYEYFIFRDIIIIMLFFIFNDIIKTFKRVRHEALDIRGESIKQITGDPFILF